MVRAETFSNDDILAEMLRLSPLDRKIADIPPTLTRRCLRLLFWGPFVICISLLVVLLVGKTEYAPAWLILAVGCASALYTALHLVIAVLRRLAFGRQDSRTPDVSVPRVHFLSHWAVYSDQGSNVAVYFLVLVYLAVVGFATLYSSISSVHPTAFSSSVETFGLTWLYFSLTTIATIGFGDVHARSVGAQLAVMAQVATGPLLLSWLVAVLLSPGDSSGNTSPATIPGMTPPPPESVTTDDYSKP